MSDDLVNLLRDRAGQNDPYDWHREIEIKAADEIARLRAENEALAQMKAATYSHVDGRDLLHELQPNGAHHIDIVVRINGQDRRYQGDWLKTLTHARDGHNMGEYADNPKLRAHIETARAALKEGAAK